MFFVQKRTQNALVLRIDLAPENLAIRWRIADKGAVTTARINHSLFGAEAGQTKHTLSDDIRSEKLTDHIRECTQTGTERNGFRLGLTTMQKGPFELVSAQLVV